MTAAMLTGLPSFASAAPPPNGDLRQTPLFVSGQQGYHTYRIPALIVTTKGTLLAFCEGRKQGRGDAGNIDLLLRRSFDGGRTWTKTQVVWDDGDNTCGNPCPVVERDTGTVWLLMTHNLGSDTQAQIMDGKSKGTRSVWVTKSTDDGATWSKPDEITRDVKKANWTWYATGPGVGIQTKRGRLVVPCDNYVAITREQQAHFIFSDDRGTTWKLGGVVGPHCNESQVVELADRSLLLNIRSYRGNNRRLVSISKDAGESWSKPVEDDALVEPVCQASIVRYSADDGGLLFSNPASKKREKMTVRLSRDEGKTWPVARVLHDGPAAYSCLAAPPDGRICCLYERGEKHAYETITFASFSLDWLAGSDLRQETASAGDWPQYGGPNRDGISSEKRLLPAWPVEGPPLLWKRTDLGTGYSPVSVVGSRVYTLAYRGEEEFVVALDRGNGTEIWSKSLGVARESHAMAFLRQRQPLVVDDRLYALSTHGHLVCLDVDQGNELWRKRYLEDLHGRSSPFGWTDYPLADGDRLICTPGGKETFHVALNSATGEVVWKSFAPAGLYPSHSPMVVAEAGGLRHYVQNLGGGLVGISATDGKLLWKYGKVSSGTANMATPAVRGDRVFAASGFNTGCALLQLIPGKDLIEAKELYHDKKFQSLHGGMVMLADHVYAGHGATFGTAFPTCYDWKSGKIVWQIRGPGQGALATIAADGRLYLRFADGLMVLAEATPEGFKEKGKFQPPHRSKSPAWSVPVIAHGRLFLRDQQFLLCYDLRADAPRKTPPKSNRPDGADGPRQPDAVFVPSAPEVVEKMLTLAKVTRDDVVYDLGSGDGRIVIAAAKKYQARGVGIELDPVLVRQARDQARQQGVADRVTIKEQDVFATDFGEATVVTLYLLPHLNLKLLPKLNKLRPGTRIVSHAFAIEGIQPEKVVRFSSADRLTEHTVYLYVTPLQFKKGASSTSSSPPARAATRTSMSTTRRPGRCCRISRRLSECMACLLRAGSGEQT